VKGPFARFLSSISRPVAIDARVAAQILSRRAADAKLLKRVTAMRRCREALERSPDYPRNRTTQS